MQEHKKEVRSDRGGVEERRMEGDGREGKGEGAGGWAEKEIERGG